MKFTFLMLDFLISLDFLQIFQVGFLFLFFPFSPLVWTAEEDENSGIFTFLKAKII